MGCRRGSCWLAVVRASWVVRLVNTRVRIKWCDYDIAGGLQFLLHELYVQCSRCKVHFMKKEAFGVRI